MSDRDRMTRRELALGAIGIALGSRDGARGAPGEPLVELPSASEEAGPPLARTLARRRSIRSWARSPLEPGELGQLLWAAQGVTRPDGRRTAPSAGALYPIELEIAAARVAGLEPALYRYVPQRHALALRSKGDLRAALAAASHGQDWMAPAPAILVVCGVVRRTAAKYGDRAERYVQMEVGHVGQNVYLQTEALGLGTVLVGAFDDAAVARLLDLPDDCFPFALMPVGRI